jgi:hypothetical protein
MRVTQKMIKAIKRHNKETCHDSDWWKIESLDITTKIQTAIHFCGKGASLKEIAQECNKVQ